MLWLQLTLKFSFLLKFPFPLTKVCMHRLFHFSTLPSIQPSSLSQFIQPFSTMSESCQASPCPTYENQWLIISYVNNVMELKTTVNHLSQTAVFFIPKDNVKAQEVFHRLMDGVGVTQIWDDNSLIYLKNLACYCWQIDQPWMEPLSNCFVPLTYDRLVPPSAASSQPGGMSYVTVKESWLESRRHLDRQADRQEKVHEQDGPSSSSSSSSSVSAFHSTSSVSTSSSALVSGFVSAVLSKRPRDDGDVGTGAATDTDDADGDAVSEPAYKKIQCVTH